MGLFQELRDFLPGLIDRLSMASKPEVHHVRYADGTESEGVHAGMMMLRVDRDGGYYDWIPAPRPEAIPAMTEHVIAHHFDDLDSFAAYLLGSDDRAVFVRCVGDGDHIEAIAMNELEPEGGSLLLVAPRHPVFLKWRRAVTPAGIVDLSHSDLADLLLDNAEDLAQPVIAKMLAHFRAARSIEYAADLDTGSEMGVRVSWSGRGAGDPKTTDAKVPREFTAHLPAYTAIWEPGSESKHEAKFRLRVIPPRGSDGGAQPTFRLSWTNLAEFELEAAQAVQEAIKASIGEDISVYLGRPGAKHYVIPRKRTPLEPHTAGE